MPPHSVLPIDAYVPEILASLERTPNLVIEAEPGTGKTTRIPPALMESLPGQVLVLEPRRIAARLAAKRVAWERSEQIGESVGYQVRFEKIGGSGTRLWFMTEGVLTRRLLSDPELQGVSAVVLDEFHERHIEGDLALALLRRLQKRRADLRIVVISATMDAAALARFLEDCPVMRCPGRLFDLKVEHLPYSPAPLQEQVRDGVDALLRRGETGNVLVFLPGAAEIRRAIAACQDLARRANRVVLPLYSELPAAEQDRAVTPTAELKIILSTNIAESSITVDGVTAVIDSGLARMASYSQWTGLPTLSVGRISKASARQRAGRAARVGPGRVLRLYSQADYEGRREYDAPEIFRSDLTQFCLSLRAMGIDDPGNLDWLDAPPAAAVERAERLLDVLVRSKGDAAELMRLPIHPRLARVITAGAQSGVGRAACMAAALLTSRERVRQSDLLEAMDTPLGEGTMQQLRHLLRLVKPSRSRMHDDDDALLQAVLTGFPDHVAQRRSGRQLMLASGVAAEMVGEAPRYALMVALDAEDRTEHAQPLVRMVARVEPEWLLDLFPERLREESSVVWNRSAERVDAVSQLRYDELILQESTTAPQDAEATAELLAKKALEAGIERFVDPDAMEDLLGRAEFAGIGAVDVSNALEQFCWGRRSFAELRSGDEDFSRWLEKTLESRRIGELAPRSLRLKGGRQTKVHYERGKTPWIASRLQDFFGMSETPRLGPGRVPIVLHLLAPNQRAVQTTTDLRGFWERLYPQVRRELMRRYPRHSWPENPLV